MSKNQEELNNKLMQAIWYKNSEEAESAIAEGAEINSKAIGHTPLIDAINSQKFDLAKKLISTYKAEVNLQNLHHNPLSAAVSKGNADMVSFLFANSEINQKAVVNTLLNFYTISSEVFDVLISKVTDINSPLAGISNSAEEVTLLEAAISKNNTELMERLVKFGVEVTDHHYNLAEKEVYSNAASALLKAEFSNIENKNKLLSQAIEFNSKMSEQLLSAGAKVESRDLMNYLDIVVKSYNSNTENREKLLPKAIKYNSEIADQLLSEGAKIDAKDVMANLAGAVKSNNTKVINVLLKHGVEVDWTAAVDKDGNSLLMLIAKNDPSLIKEYTTLQDKGGLPIFKINHENNQGEKLIDIVREKVSLIGSGNGMEIINLLRECGSDEPKNPVVLQSIKIDGNNVHAPLNEWVVKERQKELHSKYSSQEIDINSILVEIESHLMRLLKFAKRDAEMPEVIDQIYKDAELFHVAHPMSELAMEIVANPEFPKKVIGLISTLKDSLVHNVHNNSWNTSQELAYVFLECKDNGHNMDHFIANLARSIGAPWGMLVHTYRVLDSNNVYTAPESITNFNDFVLQRKAKDLADLVVKSLQSSGISNEMLQQVVKGFNHDLLKKPAKEYSNSTELVKGLFFKTFTKLMTENGKDVSKIYTLDAKDFHGALLEMLDAFEYEDEKDYNLFYKLLAKDSCAEVFNSSDSSKQSEELPKSFEQEDKILELVFQKQELVEGITGLMRENIEHTADSQCLENGYGSKHDNYGKPASSSGAVYYSYSSSSRPNFCYSDSVPSQNYSDRDSYGTRKRECEYQVDRYCKDFVINLYKIVQNNPGNMVPSMLRDDDYHAYIGVKCAILQVIEYAKEKKIVEFDADINALKADYIVGKFFARLVENNRLDNFSGFAMKVLLEHADKQINQHLYPEFGGNDHYYYEMNLTGEDNYDHVANSDV